MPVVRGLEQEIINNYGSMVSCNHGYSKSA